MALKSDDNSRGSLARTFHWVMALLIISLGLVGLWMTGLSNSPQKIKIYAIHKSVGLTVLALVLLRLSWRLFDRRPREVPMPAWQAWAAHATHWLLYALMLALPLSGWLYNSASGYPLQWFWAFNLPSLSGGADPALKSFAHFVHEWGFWLLAALLIAHVGGALKHHLLDRDDTLVRMLPLLRRRAPAPISAPATEETSVAVAESLPAPAAPTSEKGDS
jgi:cytochrome b561